MKQTAVEWLYNRLLYAGYAVNSEWLKQAKEMEKQQIEDAYTAGESDGDHYEDSYLRYYNETFNTKEK
jgi:hypothetical protein